MTVEITFRTLKGSTFKLPAEDSDTVLNLKQKVATHQNVEDFAAYRLIHNGKILQDDATVSNSNLTSAGFVVVMPPKKLPAKLKKPAPAATPKASAEPPSSSSSEPKTEPTTEPSDSKSKTNEAPATPDVNMSERPEADAPSSSTPATATTQETNAESSSNAASALVTGSAYEDSVKRICEMGFPEEQVKKAMRAAFNNPDRAVEFLFSGIPELPEPTEPSQSAATATPASLAQAATNASRATDARTQNLRSTANAAGQDQAAAQGTPFDMFAPPSTAPTGGSGAGETGAGIAASGAAPGRGSPLDFLRELPLFAQIQRLVQANPAALPQILQQVSAMHPDLIPIIQANGEEFRRLFNEPLPEGESISDEAMEQLAQAFAAGGGVSPNEAQGNPGNGGTQVYVTAEERDQINRLNELASTIGLAQRQVIQTWLACNRDETLTANFLFDNADELRADQAEEQPQNNESNNNESNQDQDSSPDRPPS